MRRRTLLRYFRDLVARLLVQRKHLRDSIIWRMPPSKDGKYPAAAIEYVRALGNVVNSEGRWFDRRNSSTPRDGSNVSEIARRWGETFAEVARFDCKYLPRGVPRIYSSNTLLDLRRLGCRKKGVENCKVWETVPWTDHRIVYSNPHPTKTEVARKYFDSNTNPCLRCQQPNRLQITEFAIAMEAANIQVERSDFQKAIHGTANITADRLMAAVMCAFLLGWIHRSFAMTVTYHACAYEAWGAALEKKYKRLAKAIASRRAGKIGSRRALKKALDSFCVVNKTDVAEAESCYKLINERYDKKNRANITALRNELASLPTAPASVVERYQSQIRFISSQMSPNEARD